MRSVPSGSADAWSRLGTLLMWNDQFRARRSAASSTGPGSARRPPWRACPHSATGQSPRPANAAPRRRDPRRIRRSSRCRSGWAGLRLGFRVGHGRRERLHNLDCRPWLPDAAARVPRPAGLPPRWSISSDRPAGRALPGLWERAGYELVKPRVTAAVAVGFNAHTEYSRRWTMLTVAASRDRQHDPLGRTGPRWPMSFLFEDFRPLAYISTSQLQEIVT